jgi:adenylate cyclase
MTDPEHTFLFADLVGYTALAESEGDARAAAVAAALQRRVRALAADHQAEVVKAMGDAAMLRCTDPSSAIRFGLRLTAEVESDPELPPVRVGIHSGPAVGSEGDWFGRAVNVASRLCAAAAGGEVLVSETTLDAAPQLPKVEVGERRLHWLKNVTEPVAARATAMNRGAMFLSAIPRRFGCPFGIGATRHAPAGGASA